MKKHLIVNVIEGSIADELGIEKGDKLISINEEEIVDVFDYEFLVDDEEIIVEIEKANDEIWEVEIEKDAEMDLGLVFESYLMDCEKRCHNKCVFCFIDQLAPNMRKTVHFKDDDYRLSFLHGNYVTLTNVKEHDIDRIIKYKLSPMNISVQVTDVEKRQEMLKNKNSHKILDYISKFYNAGIKMNTQVVLCKNFNDGKYLEKTIEDLVKYAPQIQSLSIVPVGLSKYRENLTHIEDFNKDDAVEVTEMITKFQKRFKEEIGTSFVYASDEFYILAGKEIPKYEVYENFYQIENGVGMIALFKREYEQYLNEIVFELKEEREVTVVTGKITDGFMNNIKDELEAKFEGLKVNVYSIFNEFFGPEITVTGLLTGQDIVNQLKFKSLGSKVMLCENMFKADEDKFLDDMTLSEVEEALGTKCEKVANDGMEFIKSILGVKENE